MANKDRVFIAIGAALLISALSLAIFNRNENQQAGEGAEGLLQEVQTAIAARPIQTQPTNKAPSEAAEKPNKEDIDPTMTEVVIGDYACIGYLSIPALELELPVLSEWDYERLHTAPCRQSGSTKTDDLVIAAHNYDYHFGKLKYLVEGATVIFTDMDAVQGDYTVTRLETVQPESVEQVLLSGHDLVLYTCTKGGATRVTVFCDRAE